MNKIIKKILDQHIPYDRKKSLRALSMKYGVSLSTIRYYTDERWRKKVNENSVKWRKENLARFQKYQREYHKRTYKPKI
jgi:hypothetical protein